jgi:hypothetical protein
MQAAQDAGVRYLASDASRPTQAAEQFVPGFNLILLPRYPTAVFYNATTPAENTDEYKYIFHERFLTRVVTSRAVGDGAYSFYRAAF